MGPSDRARKGLSLSNSTNYITIQSLSVCGSYCAKRLGGLIQFYAGTWHVLSNVVSCLSLHISAEWCKRYERRTGSPTSPPENSQVLGAPGVGITERFLLVHSSRKGFHVPVSGRKKSCTRHAVQDGGIVWVITLVVPSVKQKPTNIAWLRKPQKWSKLSRPVDPYPIISSLTK